MFFKKEKIPALTNPELIKVVGQVRKSVDKKEALRRSFEVITSKFRGYRFRTYILFWKAWENDPNELWRRSGFLHCTQQNYLMRVLLVSSGWFTEDELKLGYSLVWFISPHQYLKVWLDDKWIAIDPWNYRFGVRMGKYATGFGHKTLTRLGDVSGKK